MRREGTVVARNAISLLCAQGANLILPLITFPYLLRVLGPEQFGVMALALALVGYLILFTDYGFNWTATKQVAEARGSKQDISRIYWNVMAVKALLTLGGTALLAVVVLTVPAVAEIVKVLACTWVLVLASMISPQWLFQGLERMWVVPAWLTVGRALSVALTFWLVRERGDAWLAALLNALGAVFGAVVAAGWIVRTQSVRWCRPQWAEMKSQLAEGRHLFLSSAVMTLFSATNAVLLGLVAGPMVLGLFAAADKLRNVLWMTLSQISTAFFPRVNATMVNDVDAGYRLIAKLLRWQGGAALVISTSLCLLAEPVTALVMGGEYGPATDALRWLAFAPLFTTLTTVFGLQAMVAVGLKQQFSRLVVIAGLANLAVFSSLAWVWGLMGAAAAVLLVEAGLAVLVFVSARAHGVQVRGILRYAWAA